MKCAIFASGTGTNFQAIVKATERKQLNVEVVLLVCDHPEAVVVRKAQDAGIPTFVFNPKDYPDKAAYEHDVLVSLRARGAQWCILAGYMRLIGPTLLSAYRDHIINIHPSLLPKYKGKDALGQALAQGDEELGVSVHFVNEALDGGTIIRQARFKRYPGQQR